MIRRCRTQMSDGVCSSDVASEMGRLTMLTTAERGGLTGALLPGLVEQMPVSVADLYGSHLRYSRRPDTGSLPSNCEDLAERTTTNRPVVERRRPCRPVDERRSRRSASAVIGN